MPYSTAHSRLDTAIGLYDRGEFRRALNELYRAREVLGEDPEGIANHISRYIAKCMAELKGR